MNSTSSNSVSYKTHDLPVGYVFNPDEDEIYSYFIPNRILEARPMHGVEELDLYEKSPDALFGTRDPAKHIYLFTRQKKEKETHTRVKRSAGGGTWLGQKPTTCHRVFNGEEITVGTMKQFTYKGGKEEWIMHEYCVEDKFLNYMIDGANPNPLNIVLCHIYNKKAKKGNEIRRNNEEINQQKKRKRNSNNYEDNHENVDDGFNNNGVSSVQKQEENTMWMTNYNNVPQPLLPEPLSEPQAFDQSNVNQAHDLVPQGEDDFMQQFLMEHFDKMSLPENDIVIQDFMNDCGNGDNNGFIVQEPVYCPSTADTYYEVGNDGFSLVDLMMNY